MSSIDPMQEEKVMNKSVHINRTVKSVIGSVFTRFTMNRIIAWLLNLYSLDGDGSRASQRMGNEYIFSTFKKLSSAKSFKLRWDQTQIEFHTAMKMCLQRCSPSTPWKLFENNKFPFNEVKLNSALEGSWKFTIAWCLPTTYMLYWRWLCSTLSTWL